MENNYKASLVIPAYEEESGINNVLIELVNLKKNKPFIDEIIVVDDGSIDKTAEIVRLYSEFKLIQHSHNRGYGASLKTGIENAKNGIITIIDADCTYPVDKIPNLISQLVENDLDMVVGARTGGNIKHPFVRRPGKWVIGKFANWVTQQQIPDINSGLRVFKKSSFIPFQYIVPEGYSFTTTITLGMLLGGYKVKFIPIDYFKRSGKSKIKPIQDTLNFIKLIFKIGIYFKPLKIFMPISIVLILTAIAWGVFTKVVLGNLADVSALIIILAGFQVAMLALIAELINHRLPNKYMK